jgi:LacI family transcriptional regulator
MLAAHTVRRVLEAARELGYTTNTFARGLRTNRSMTIGVLIPDLTNPLFPPIVRGIEEALLPRGYTALIANTDNDVERGRSHFHTLLSRQVDGFIFATARQRDVILAEAEQRGVAAVLVNRSNNDRRFPLITGDDREGIRAAVGHLVELGHRRIAHLAGPDGVSTSVVRASAFREAVAAHGIPTEDAPVIACDGFTESGGTAGTNRLLDTRPELTAIVAGNDLIALGALRAIVAHGLSCPRDLSLTGFNDMRFADALSPGLTTVRVPHQLMGAETARLLLKRLDEPGTVAETLLMPVDLVVRASTDRVRAGG